MSAFMSTDEAFKDATDRYLTLLGNGSVDTFDPMMVPVIKHLNTLEGVATVFCCEGHPELTKDRTAYVMFALQPKGIDKLNILFRRLAEKLYDNQSCLTLVHLTDLEFKMVNRCSPTTRRPYFAHSLNVRLRSEEQKKWFYKVLYEMLRISK